MIPSPEDRALAEEAFEEFLVEEMQDLERRGKGFVYRFNWMIGLMRTQDDLIERALAEYCRPDLTT